MYIYTYTHMCVILGPVRWGACGFPGLQILNCVLQITNLQLLIFHHTGELHNFLQAEELASLISTVPTDAPASNMGHLWTIEGSDGLAGAC